ncbi:ATP synthase subunit delta, mitochondrial [Geodia barretti]|uniref:ATP synthase F(1) complex subunit delta, mitochondrial n=1 Tax=Geodia barretti TaxID=519541 RepID=A0AA35XHP0_GEOBA|nr:ATP synthase subunit delta, mitochondrial [Geodia barretti]
MASRLLSLARGSVRSGRLLALRNYTNGEIAIPLTFSSPNSTFYDNVNVKQVDVSSTTGTFGILPHHVPSIAVLQPGLVTVYETDKTQKYFASSGTVTVNADGTVQILAEEAYPLDMFDAQAARQGLDKCKQQRSSASSDAERAEADIGIELYENLIKALE